MFNGIKNLFIGEEDVDYKLENLFNLDLKSDKFIELKVKRLYKKILNDCFSRSLNLDDKYKTCFFDNALVNEANKGLITLLVDSMYNKSDLCLVYAGNIVRCATFEEKNNIVKEINNNGRSKQGIALSFKNYEQTDLLKLYSYFIYTILDTANTQMKIGRSLQLKISDLRKGVSNDSSYEAIKQAKTIIKSIKSGESVLLDSKDDLSITKADITPSKVAWEFINKQIAEELGMPISYCTGELSSGISSTGEADSTATERGLFPYFVSIYKPVVDSLFGTNIAFRSDNWRKIAEAKDVVSLLNTTTVIDEEKKKAIIDNIFS